MMKKVLLYFVMVIMALSLCALSEEDAVKKVITEAYVEGIHNGGSLEAIDKGFHPSFVLPGIGQDGITITQLPIYTWREMIRQNKEAGKKPTVRTDCRFLSVDITGSAAMVKIELVREGKTIFTDYLGLYKFKDGWRLVNKIYHRH
jgi:hypothetical protein